MIRKCSVVLTALALLAPVDGHTQMCDENNQAPEPTCRDYFEVAVNDECNWDLGSADLIGDFADPEGDALTCWSSPSMGDGLQMRPLNVYCADDCGNESPARCEPLVVPRDWTAPSVNVTRPVVEYDIVEYGSHVSWTSLRRACGLEYNDNCDRSDRLIRGIVDVHSSDPKEIIDGSPGDFFSPAMRADWSGFTVDSDLRRSVPRAYSFDYAVVDLRDNWTLVVCHIVLRPPEAPPADTELVLQWSRATWQGSSDDTGIWLHKGASSNNQLRLRGSITSTAGAIRGGL